MRGFAKFTFLGRIAKDPSMSSLENGTKRLQIVCAANVPYKKKDSDEWQENTTWITFAWFGEFASRMKDRVRKGLWVHITGEIRSSVEEVNGQKITRYNFCPEKVIPFEVVTNAMREQMGGDAPPDEPGPF